eukprot:gene10199-2618_t
MFSSKSQEIEIDPTLVWRVSMIQEKEFKEEGTYFESIVKSGHFRINIIKKNLKSKITYDLLVNDKSESTGEIDIDWVGIIHLPLNGEKGECARYYFSTATENYLVSPKDENKEWVEIKKNGFF